MGDGVGRRQREIWHEERERLGLVRGRPALGREGVMRVLDGQSVQVTLLPADPLARVTGFDEPLMSALPRDFTGQMARRCPAFGTEGLRSDHAMRLTQGDPARGHRAVLAVHRNGGVTVGLSDGEAVVEHDHGGERQRIYLLFMIVGAVRLALQAQEQVLGVLGERGTAPSGPWEISVALPGADGAWLGGAAQGWDDVRHVLPTDVHGPDAVGPRRDAGGAPRGGRAPRGAHPSGSPGRQRVRNLRAAAHPLR
ncbi:MAG: hypothetical protein M3Q22_11630 [Actinomycetota bacterium]|jgi:hypothetical protein|nr:hypothetical protein [Actinomycetota bacterium]